jgi:hypothetical protein
MDPSTGIDLEFQPVAYDTRNSTRMKVPCSICPQKQAHFDGAIVRLKDKKVGLVGNDCGKRHFFGDDGWVSLQNRMRVNEDRAVFLARFGPAKDRIDALEPLLTRWSRKFRGRKEIPGTQYPIDIKGITRIQIIYCALRMECIAYPTFFRALLPPKAWPVTASQP